jgi:LPXTG-site transpeptidase (sortase) family protein
VIKYARIIGFSLVGIGVAILFFTYLPVAREEIRYSVTKLLPTPQSSPTPVEPASREFGILIPKIGANAPVVPEVDPYNASEYQYRLTKGVAHAKGTAYPGESGNIFIFAHSAGNWTEANRYNAVFYLISKLEKGDEIILWYNFNSFRYIVSETKLVDASEVQYLDPHYSAKTLTLMTCWPPGTTIRRFLVIAALQP